jgi:glycosyltransferase involved in cell wall biosynthesis
MSQSNFKTKVDPLVSVVVPYYKHKHYIKDCLESIVAQTYENLELVVVDDCSPDGSGEYVEQILKNKDWLKRFSHKIGFTHFQSNQGAYAAINYGINQAQGEIIVIVNSDDLCHSERIRIMVSLMQKEQKEFAVSGVIYIDDKREDVSKANQQATDFTFLQKEVINFPTLGFASLTGNFGISTGNFVFTKNLYKLTVGFRNLRYCHDWDFLLQCVFHTEPLFVQQKLYYYRLHETNSFKFLQEEGANINDTENVLRRYFDSVRCQKTINPLAPSPFNWPGYFELFLNLHNYEEHYRQSVYANL